MKMSVYFISFCLMILMVSFISAFNENISNSTGTESNITFSVNASLNNSNSTPTFYNNRTYNNSFSNRTRQIFIENFTSPQLPKNDTSPSFSNGTTSSWKEDNESNYSYFLHRVNYTLKVTEESNYTFSFYYNESNTSSYYSNVSNFSVYINSSYSINVSISPRVTNFSSFNISLKAALNASQYVRTVNEVTINVDLGRAIYVVKGKKSGKLFWIIPVSAEVVQEVDATSGEIINTRSPWWSFLASEI
ncbi:hypothetical protein FJZ18_01720 [Candidatus Pacearchaeota archaeon]|nr:hypothetical protein [Candidatus Pacearchaeota archaeon]